MATIYRDSSRQRRVPMPREAYPSGLGAAQPLALHPYLAGDKTPPNSESIQGDAIRCGQCGAGQYLSESDTCYNCGSDNRLNVPL